MARRPGWLKRPLKPVANAYQIPDWMKNGNGHARVNGASDAVTRDALPADD
ncbi:MAG: hypothetical protein R2867_46990 [Caldilineaceae bacterium]